MTKSATFKYFETNPEIIGLAVMLNIRFPAGPEPALVTSLAVLHRVQQARLDVVARHPVTALFAGVGIGMGTVPQGRSAPHPEALLLGGGDLVAGALGSDLALEPGEGQKHVQAQTSHGGDGVEGLGDGGEKTSDATAQKIAILTLTPWKNGTVYNWNEEAIGLLHFPPDRLGAGSSKAAGLSIRLGCWGRQKTANPTPDIGDDPAPKFIIS